MDSRRFDDLTKALATGTSRRRVLKGLAGALAGATLGLAGERRADAARGYGRVCTNGAQCATGYCKAYPNGQGRCLCPDEELYCGGACAAAQTDPNNCGACGRSCPTVANATTVCANGQCGFVCNDGYSPDGAGGCSAPPPPPVPINQTGDGALTSGNGVSFTVAGTVTGTPATGPFTGTATITPGSTTTVSGTITITDAASTATYTFDYTSVFTSTGTGAGTLSGTFTVTGATATYSPGLVGKTGSFSGVINLGTGNFDFTIVEAP